MWSAMRMVSSSCSTTITVLPRSRRRTHRVDEPLVVTLVESDRRLVEHVQHPDQAAADLRRESDALRLAAGQRRRRTIEAQVVEADVRAGSANRSLTSSPPVRRSCGRARRDRVSRGTPRHCGSRARQRRRCCAHRCDRKRRRPQPRTTARRARHLAHVALDLLARAVALRLRVPTLEPRHHTFELRGVRALASVAVAVRHLHRGLAGAVEDDPACPSSSASSTACRWRSRTRGHRLEHRARRLVAAEARPRREWRRPSD